LSNGQTIRSAHRTLAGNLHLVQLKFKCTSQELKMSYIIFSKSMTWIWKIDYVLATSLLMPILLLSSQILYHFPLHPETCPAHRIYSTATTLIYVVPCVSVCCN